MVFVILGHLSSSRADVKTDYPHPSKELSTCSTSYHTCDNHKVLDLLLLNLTCCRRYPLGVETLIPLPFDLNLVVEEYFPEFRQGELIASALSLHMMVVPKNLKDIKQFSWCHHAAEGKRYAYSLLFLLIDF